MTTRHPIPLVILSFLLLAFAAQAAESLSVLLQKGIFAEETEGNLDVAIRIYEGIVKEADANRSLVAQAQYRLGVCQMKRGKKDEAEAAFRGLIGNFTDQAELQAKARQRMKELGKPVSLTVVRQVWAAAAEAVGGVSQDGRYVSFVDWDTGDLAVRDLTTGQNRHLTGKGSWKKSAEFAEASVFSPDGMQLAFSWYSTNGHVDLKTMFWHDAKSRVLVSRHWLWPADWSSKRNAIAVVAANDKREPEILLVSPSDGSVRSLKSLSSVPSGMRFSPDGRFIAYSCPTETSRESDIFLIDLDNGVVTTLVEHPSEDTVVEWLPDGSGLLVGSDRRGSTDFWLLPMTSNRTWGEMVLLKAGVGQISPMGFTKTGAFYYRVLARSSVLYEASIDLGTGKLLFPPKEIRSRFSGSKERRRLSTDGRFLAFSNRRGSKDSFYIEDLRTGQIQEIPLFPTVSKYFWPRWSPDSKYLLVRGQSSGFQNGLYLINRSTGETSVQTLAEPGSDEGYGWLGFDNGTVRYSLAEPAKKRHVFVRHDLKDGTKREEKINNLPDDADSSLHDRDGKLLFYIRSGRTESGRPYWSVIRRDLDSGKEKELLRSTNRFIFPPWDTTMDHSIMILELNPNNAHRVKMVDATEDLVRERFSVELPRGANLRWDWLGSRPHFLFTKSALQGKEPAVELWIISGETGELKKTELTMPGLAIVGTHGENQIIFEKTGPDLSEVWVMENFLPPVAAAK